MIRLIKSMLLPAGIATSLSVQAELTKPNIIVFIADDLGWEDLEPYGNNKIQTPNINKLAKEGCRFDKVFLTASSSSPSRASILTALYPSETGASELHQPLSAGQIVASTPLRNIGYYTVSAGKWHLGDVKDQWDKVQIVPGNSSAEMGDIWINTIQHLPENKPFFIWAAANDPHRTYDEITPKVNNPDSLKLPTYLPNLSVVRNDYADYYNEISRFDTHVGMAVDELKRLGLYENTIIVIMSDNGSPMPTAKTRTNLQGMKTPLIIVNAARIQPNTCNRALISSIDIMPTLLEWAGTQYPNTVSGISFAGICPDNKQIFREYAFAEHNWHDFMAYERAIYSDSLILNVNYLPHLPATPPNDVVKSKAYQVFRQAFENGELNGKYQETFYSPRSEYELWNYEKDPHCTVNEVKNKDFSEQFKKMNRALKTHLKQTRSYRDIKYLTKDKYDRKTGALIK
ncbi:MAG: sulfatase-like hydrolase/transferase [Lentimicrobium sp.]|nr:sulfatase-like hydrolase/transferase [Lentimicrobium sp.]